MRLGVLVLTVVLAAAACATPEPAPAPPADVVFYESTTGITAVDGRGTVLAAGATAAAPDWSRLYTVRGDQFVGVDPATNQEVTGTTVPPGFTARVVSADGTLVALADSASSTHEPTPRERTRIVVAHPNGPARVLELAGNFEPEAFSSDGTQLFVLEYLPANAPERYRVRRVDVATGSVQPLLLRSKLVVPPGAEEEMRGEGRQSVLAPDRSRLYTLYLHQPDHQHTRDLLPGHDGVNLPQVHAFVHVLSLTEGWAYCLDLPTPFGELPAETHSLTVSPDGARLYVGELTTKQVAIADTESLTVSKVAFLEDDEPTGDSATMSMSPDGAALYVGSGNVVRSLDPVTLRVRATWRAPDAIRGVAVAPDGDQLLVGQPGRVVRVDTATGKVVGVFTAADLRTVYASTNR